MVNLNFSRFVVMLRTGYNIRTMRNEYITIPRRSRGLLLLTGLLAVFQAGAAFQVLRIPGELAAQISIPLPLEFITSGLWACLAAIVTIGLWQRRRGVEKKAVGLLIAFMIYSLLRLIVFARADYDRGRLVFLTLLLIVITAYIVIRSFLSSKRHSTEIIENDRRPQD
jgi:hypothetical protein